MSDLWDSPPPIPDKPVAPPKDWMPVLNPTQQKAVDTTARFTLLYGERGSGKTIAVCHAAVRHCFENTNAFALLGALSIRTGKGGILYDLENLVLPAWRDGNRYPEWEDGKPHPKAGELMDEGIGLEFTASKQDPDTKDRILWIRNMHGGWSMVMLVSLPFAEVVAARTRGPAPSFIGFEELTLASSSEYFTSLAAQLGRRRGMGRSPQQFYASANPEGPSNWVYQKFFIDSVDPMTGKRDPDYAVYHVPISENLRFLPPGYHEQIKKAYRDPIEYRRMVLGEWVDRPSGDAIFKQYFAPEIHIKGDWSKNIGIIPIKGFPIIIGYDPGAVNFCICLLQRIITKQRSFWWQLDELNFVGKFTPYKQVIPQLLRRMDYWNEIVDTEFKYVHIADQAAFNQTRTDGSYDAHEIERLGAGRIKLRACPKGAESVPQRMQMMISMLLAEELFISARCQKTIEAIRMLSSKKSEPGKYDPHAGLRPLRSIYLHPIDALSYPLFYFDLQPGKFTTVHNYEPIETLAYAAGSG